MGCHRKKLVYFPLLVVFLYGCNAKPAVTASTTRPAATVQAAAWQPVAVHNVHHSVMTAGFLTEEFGITGGVIGIMYHTADGGATWNEGANQSDCRYGMDIVDTHVAWTCGGFSQVRLSTDGGRHWQAVTDFAQGTTRPCHTISFLDDRTGWLATLYQLGSTVDGGGTWQMLPQPAGIDDIAAVDLVAPGQGYLLDFSGVLYATRDNGAAWTTAARLGLDGLVIPKEAYQMAAVRFSPDGRRGLIVVSEEYRKGRVRAFHTADGGATWTSEMVPAASGPVFISRQEPLLTILDGANIMTLLRYAGER